MRTRFLIATLLLSACTLTFAAPKTVRKSSATSGILITGGMSFGVMGDGISTTFSFNPWRIPQGGNQGIPLLPLVGISAEGSGCNGNFTFTASVSGPRQVTVTFQTPPPSDTFLGCTLSMLFQPQ